MTPPKQVLQTDLYGFGFCAVVSGRWLNQPDSTGREARFLSCRPRSDLQLKGHLFVHCRRAHSRASPTFRLGELCRNEWQPCCCCGPSLRVQVVAGGGPTRWTARGSSGCSGGRYPNRAIRRIRSTVRSATRRHPDPSVARCRHAPLARDAPSESGQRNGRRIHVQKRKPLERGIVPRLLGCPRTIDDSPPPGQPSHESIPRWRERLVRRSRGRCGEIPGGGRPGVRFTSRTGDTAAL